MAKTKTIKKVPKAGDYFKGEIDNKFITGRITTQTDYYDKEKAMELAVLFTLADDNNYCASGDVDDDFRFESQEDISNITNLEIITKAQHEKLLENPLYSGWGDYNISIVRGRTKNKDLFKFGCGEVVLTRAELEKLYLFLTKNKPSSLEQFMDLLHTMEEYSSRLKDSDLPKIKQLLDA